MEKSKLRPRQIGEPLIFREWSKHSASIDLLSYVVPLVNPWLLSFFYWLMESIIKVCLSSYSHLPGAWLQVPAVGTEYCLVFNVSSCYTSLYTLSIWTDCSSLRPEALSSILIVHIPRFPQLAIFHSLQDALKLTKMGGGLRLFHMHTSTSPRHCA